MNRVQGRQNKRQFFQGIVAESKKYQKYQPIINECKVKPQQQCKTDSRALSLAFTEAQKAIDVNTSVNAQPVNIECQAG